MRCGGGRRAGARERISTGRQGGDACAWRTQRRALAPADAPPAEPRRLWSRPQRQPAARRSCRSGKTAQAGGKVHSQPWARRGGRCCPHRTRLDFGAVPQERQHVACVAGGGAQRDDPGGSGRAAEQRSAQRAAGAASRIAALGRLSDGQREAQAEGPAGCGNGCVRSRAGVAPCAHRRHHARRERQAAAEGLQQRSPGAQRLVAQQVAGAQQRQADQRARKDVRPLRIGGQECGASAAGADLGAMGPDLRDARAHAPHAAAWPAAARRGRRARRRRPAPRPLRRRAAACAPRRRPAATPARRAWWPATPPRARRQAATWRRVRGAERAGEGGKPGRLEPALRARMGASACALRACATE